MRTNYANNNLNEDDNLINQQFIIKVLAKLREHAFK
jgi:hypothetical protein